MITDTRLHSSNGDGILVVDDIPENSRSLGMLIQKNTDYKVRIASDGETVLNTIDNNLPELILLDIMMPVMDGFEVARRLKDNPLTRDIPIIFITALTASESRVQGFDVGGVDYISKPFDKAEVMRRIDVHIKLKRQYENIVSLSSKLNTMIEELQVSRDDLAMSSNQYQKMNFQVSSMIFEFKNRVMICQNGAHVLRNRIPKSGKMLLEPLGCIENETEVLIWMADNLLKFGSPITFSFEPLDVTTVLDMIVQLLGRELKRNNIDMSTGPAVAGALVRADKSQLHLVFMNLIVNAIEAQPHGGEIDIQYRRVKNPKGGQELAIDFIDKGTGMDVESTKKVFEPFYTTWVDGSGLGLYVSRIITQRHGGRIEVMTHEGKGTTVTVILPEISGN